ncbi:hypothetical protein MHD_09560 [Mannheimia granulomatis]|uniref:Pertactin n=1 Tax=Mannheimia granulomatis TaxID=85402 RepID=A0A011LYX8_9PAST|nr:autotransporter outer membrane beta-barrel domain-containing protein [Mannheimia granulomatis]EXI62438.1 pertactin [Mannheimia granulomatis]RGE47503.1 hypothetical protein MHD_09560 [Mannheimia granulomatis]
MTQHHFFKLSAISIALLGAASQGYAVECKVPMSVENQQNGNLDSCNLNIDATENRSLFNQSSLLNISNSTFHINNSTLTFSGKHGADVIAIKDSNVEITNSRLTRNNTDDKDISSETIRIRDGKTGISSLTLDNVTLVSTGEASAIALYATENEDSLTSITLKDSNISSEDSIFGSWWSTSRPINEYSNWNIKVENSVLKAPIILSTGGLTELYKTDGVVATEKTTLSANNSQFFGSMLSFDSDADKSKTDVSLTSSSWVLPTARDLDTNVVAHNGVTNLKLDESQITLENNLGLQTFTIYGNLSGNGHFDLNTDLANQKSDKIVVKGEDSGNFTLGIKDSGNEPNAANGKVTLVETQQGQATFSLKDRDYVDAGAYRYRLNKEGTNWVLANRQSERVTTSQPTTPTQPVVQPTSPTVPTQPVVQPTTPTVPSQPVIQPTQPSVPVSPALLALSEKSNALASLRQAQSVLVSQNLQGIHQRLGELKTDKSSNVWVKNINSRTEAKAQNVAADSRSSGFEMDSHSLQIGADRAVSDNFRLGGFVGTSRADVDFNGEYGKGKLRSQAVGFYATFANADGWYVDNVGKYERLTAQASNEKRKYNAFSLSSEVGKRIALSNDWMVTPQAQLAYHTINGKADESRLSLFTARAGMRIAKGFTLASGWNLQPYAEFNAIAEKANNAKVRVNQYRFDVPENRGRFQTSIGFTAGNGSHRVGLEASTTHGKQLKQPLAVLANYRYQW